MARKFLLWYMEYPPFNPYAAISFGLDFSPALNYLAGLDNASRPRVSVQHLVSGALARTYAEFPQANASVFRNRIIAHRHVGCAVPVDLKQGTRRGPVGAILLERAEALSLRQIAEQTRRGVQSERASELPQNAFFRTLMPLVERLPMGVFTWLLDGVDRAAQLPGVGRLLHSLFPLTTVVTNVGATLGLPEGALARGGAFFPSARFFGIGSMLAVFPIQQEVIAEGGVPVVRPVLPLTYVFDHRLFDGVMCGRILTRFVQILQDPAAVFGEDAERRGPREVDPQRQSQAGV